MRELFYWVVRLNKLYLTSWDIKGVSADSDLQKAFRYQNERDATFVAGKVKGEVVKCRMNRRGLEVVRT